FVPYIYDLLILQLFPTRRSSDLVSEAAPTLITATPPANLARRSCNLSASKSEVVSSSSLRICATRDSIAAGFPDPSTIVVLSLEDRKSTRLNSCHVSISYAVFCL